MIGNEALAEEGVVPYIEPGENYFIQATLNNQTRYIHLENGAIRVGNEEPDNSNYVFRAYINPLEPDDVAFYVRDENSEGFMTIFLASDGSWQLNASVEDPVYFRLQPYPEMLTFSMERTLEGETNFITMISHNLDMPVEMEADDASGEKTQKWKFARVDPNKLMKNRRPRYHDELVLGGNKIMAKRKSRQMAKQETSKYK